MSDTFPCKRKYEVTITDGDGVQILYCGKNFLTATKLWNTVIIEYAESGRISRVIIAFWQNGKPVRINRNETLL